MRIIIDTEKSVNDIRYETAGDYFFDENGDLNIWITEQKNDEYSFLILIHEVIEEYLTRKNGISEEIILEWDLKFEEDRSKGLHGENDEPGDHLDCPYFDAHRFATKIEQKIADYLKVDWTKYSNEIVFKKEQKHIDPQIGK